MDSLHGFNYAKSGRKRVNQLCNGVLDIQRNNVIKTNFSTSSPNNLR